MRASSSNTPGSGTVRRSQRLRDVEKGTPRRVDADSTQQRSFDRLRMLENDSYGHTLQDPWAASEEEHSGDSDFGERKRGRLARCGARSQRRYPRRTLEEAAQTVMVDPLGQGPSLHTLPFLLVRLV